MKFERKKKEKMSFSKEWNSKEKTIFERTLFDQLTYYALNYAKHMQTIKFKFSVAPWPVLGT
jgi:methionyl-tRNA synthetase